MEFEIVQASKNHGEFLAEIRVSAMRESLEAVGRFEPERARERFLASFVPENTQMLLVLGEVVGFYVVVEKDSCLYLDHLYVAPSMQGGNVGSSVISKLKTTAAELGLPICLGALRNSRSNEFYQKNGFVKTHEEEWDIYYKWEMF